MANLADPAIQDFAGLITDSIDEMNALLENDSLSDFQRKRFEGMRKRLNNLLSRVKDVNDKTNPETMAEYFQSTANETISMISDFGFDESSFSALNEDSLRILTGQPSTPPIGEIADHIVGNTSDPTMRKLQIQTAAETLLKGEGQRDFQQRLMGLMDSKGIIPPSPFGDRPLGYAEMVSRTVFAEVRRIQTRERAAKAGIEYGQISFHGSSDPCRFAEGVVFTWGEKKPGFPTYAEVVAINPHLFHPNCRHTTVNYIPDLVDDNDAKAAKNHTDAFNQYAALSEDERDRMRLDALGDARAENADSWDSSATEEGV